MSVYTVIYQALSSHEDLTIQLAASTINSNNPAIYERWATADETPMPYINLNYYVAADPNNKWKRNGRMEAHIFTEQNSVLAENIGREIKEALLLIEAPESEQDGRIRIYPGTTEGGLQPTESPGIIHWSETFDFSYWDKQIITQL